MDDAEYVSPRRHSKVQAYYHVVWTTKGRQPRLTDEYERRVYRIIGDAAKRNGITLIAIGGIADHVHVVVRAPGKFGPADVAKLLKGPSSALMNDLHPEFTEPFRWQSGYGCFTLSRPHVDAAMAYVKGQKEHHANGSLWPEWEETEEEASESP